MEKKALRYDTGKLDWTLLDFQSLEPAVKVMTYGAKKYTITSPDGSVVDGRDNWKNKCEDPKQHLRCAFRHLIAIANGQDIDPESGELHSGHVICNMMMLNYHYKPVAEKETEPDKKSPTEAEIMRGMEYDLRD